MDRELLVQRLRQIASNKILNEQISATLDCAANIIERKTKTAEVELEGGGSTWFYVCSECRTAINRWDKYCHECERRLIRNE